jgi:hypothetical protein
VSEFLYRSRTVTLADQEGVDFDALEFVTLSASTGNLLVAARGSQSFGPMQLHQVIGDGRAQLGGIKIRNETGAPVTFTVVTSSVRVQWADGTSGANVNITGSITIPVSSTNLANIDADIGSTNDAAAATDTGTYSLIALIKRLLSKLTTQLPAALGQTTMAASMPVTLASNQAAIATAGLLSVKTDQTTHGTTDKVAADLYVGGVAAAGGTGVVGSSSTRVVLASGSTTTIVDAAATTNAANLKATAAQVYSVTAYNQSAAARYLRLFNKATAPTPGTDVPVITMAIPVNTHVSLLFGSPLTFPTGLGYCCTTGAPYTDATATALHDVQFAINWA